MRCEECCDAGPFGESVQKVCSGACHRRVHRSSRRCELARYMQLRSLAVGRCWVLRVSTKLHAWLRATDFGRDRSFELEKNWFPMLASSLLYFHRAWVLPLFAKTAFDGCPTTAAAAASRSLVAKPSVTSPGWMCQTFALDTWVPSHCWRSWKMGEDFRNNTRMDCRE